MQKLLVATTNKGKFGEFQEMLGDLPWELVFLGDLKVEKILEEDGETFADNAILKAVHFADLLKMPAIADDSGILVEALPGELGVKTRRWGAGANASDQEWIAYFLEKMEGVENRNAQFVAAVAIAWPDDELVVFEGQTKGKITAGLEAPIVNGIPLSSCFRHEGGDKVYAALTEEEKNRVSHRGKALMQAKKFLLSKV